jgi:hypothetical protein
MNLCKNRRVLPASQVLFGDRGVGRKEQADNEAAFFKSICLPNGTHKTTASGRLTDVDIGLESILERRSTIQLLDVGISSGITTVELLDVLKDRGHRVECVGVDLRIEAYLRRWMGVEILYDPEGKILQLATPFMVKGRPEPGLRLTKAVLLRRVFSALEKAFVRHWKARPSHARRVSLLTPCLSARADVTICEQDITQTLSHLAGRFDVVRAANILNRAYFSPEVLLRAVKNLTETLKLHGLFVICRTSEEDTTNHATIFKKMGESILAPVWRSGEGSEIEPMLV